MNPIDPGAPLTSEDRERLYIIKRAVAAGTFHISGDDVDTKLILSMLESVDVASLSETTSSSETEVEGLPLDRKNGMNALQIVNVEQDGPDGILVMFSDGTIAGYVAEELIELRPIRDKVRRPATASRSMAGPTNTSRASH